jgi:hypothetical protein
MDRYERRVDIRLDEATNPSLKDEYSSYRSLGLRIVDLEDLAEDKSWLRPPPSNNMKASDIQSYSRLYQLPPSERLTYAQKHSDEFGALCEKDKYRVGTLLCHASPAGSREASPIMSDLREEPSAIGLADGNPCPVQAPAAAATLSYQIIEGCAAIAVEPALGDKDDPIVLQTTAASPARPSQQPAAHSFGTNARAIERLYMLRLTGGDCASLDRAIAARPLDLADDVDLGLAERLEFGLIHPARSQTAEMLRAA